ncbi:hypothetical protein EV361DRAFT_785688, partial [Lentinula raphanica]
FEILDRHLFLPTTDCRDGVCSVRGNDVIIVLVRNKTDLSVNGMPPPQVMLEDATATVTGMNVLFLHTSPYGSHDVQSLFNKFAVSLPGMEME